MTDEVSGRGLHSLATAPSSTGVRVEGIMFEYVRAYCRQVGIHRGARLGPVRRGESDVRVQIRGGEEVAVPLEYAHFVRVAPEDPVDSGEDASVPDPNREPAPTSANSESI